MGEVIYFLLEEKVYEWRKGFLGVWFGVGFLG